MRNATNAGRLALAVLLTAYAAATCRIIWQLKAQIRHLQQEHGTGSPRPAQESVWDWFCRLKKLCGQGRLPGFTPSDFNLPYFDCEDNADRSSLAEGCPVPERR